MMHRAAKGLLAFGIVCALCVVALALGGQRLAAGWVWSRLVFPTYPEQAPPEPLPDLRARTCGGCHPQQLQDWSSSRMAQSMTDPIFLADYRAQGEPFLCLYCHAPLSQQRPLVVTGMKAVRPLTPIATANPRFDPELQREGVTCVTCHLVDGVIRGPRGASGVHATRSDPSLREAATCEGCHQVAIPPGAFRLDRPLADTHTEWASWKEATGRSETCTDCHMPEGRHTFRGAFDAEMLRSGLTVEVVRGDGTQVRLTNTAGHAYPTGEPGRALVVRVGSEEQVLARIVPLPRYIDQGDTTLRPAEVRTLHFAGSGEVVVSMDPVRFLEHAPRVPLIEIARVP